MTGPWCSHAAWPQTLVSPCGAAQKEKQYTRDRAATVVIRAALPLSIFSFLQAVGVNKIIISVTLYETGIVIVQ